MTSFSRYLSIDSDDEETDDIEVFQRPYHRYSLDLPGIVTREKPSQTGGVGPKLVVAMVGLPARGKSYIVKKLKRYLTWLQYETKVFNVGNLRRNTQLIKNELTPNNHSHLFFDPDNEYAKKVREQVAMDCLDELIDWLKRGGRVGIHDATNSTAARRKKILERCQREHSFKVLFIESICNDEEVLESNMRLKLLGPDYKNMDPEEALKDFRKRVTNYEKVYETINEEEEEKNNVQYCKLINVGKKIIAHNIKGYLSSQCIFYLMNLNLVERQIWLTRHGESTDNVIGRIGGDAPLSKSGRKYGACLSRFIYTQKKLFRQKQLEKYRGFSGSSTPLPEPPERNFLVWTSILKRTVETAENFDPKEFDIMHIRFLNEIYAGLCEEMTYQEIEKSYPEEYNARKNNKLYYRYPGMGGESYLDVIHRVNPLIIELERMTDNIMVITHRVVLRILLAYFLDVEKEKVPNMDVPLHTIYCLQPKPYGTELTKWKYDDDQDCFSQIE
ncbi:6-phosphofructo-2-kinase-domain-containing protein [Glomus cerebriforme]|uniref:6-phosphofructo-2-kinase-domain-containing protein n=1 Tax=Glomus cerebriforme TaxID=658196 RepID=A0A397SGV9_9GLOM|nr:6-phosphofructo-2-kinase-domain-containing protein [Glomus cerebriforme]